MLITPERIADAQRQIGAHRRRGDVPDGTITRKILLYFNDVEAFEAWIADIKNTLNPSDITGAGYGLYLRDACQWSQGGGRRRKRRRKATVTNQYHRWAPPSIEPV